jgi:hypothetical protein
LFIDGADAAVYCYLTTVSFGGPDSHYGGSSVAGHYQQASITDFFFVSAGDALQLVCESNLNDANSFVNSAAMTATLIGSANARSEGAAKPHHQVVHSGDPKAPE